MICNAIIPLIKALNNFGMKNLLQLMKIVEFVLDLAFLFEPLTRVSASMVIGQFLFVHTNVFRKHFSFITR